MKADESARDMGENPKEIATGKGRLAKEARTGCDVYMRAHSEWPPISTPTFCSCISGHNALPIVVGAASSSPTMRHHCAWHIATPSVIVLGVASMGSV